MRFRIPVPYRDARRMRNSVLSSVLALHADRNPYLAFFPLKRGISEIRIPDSSSVSQCDRDTEFISCSGLAGSGIVCSGSGRAIVHR